jgi:hypothetical protein
MLNGQKNEIQHFMRATLIMVGSQINDMPVTILINKEKVLAQDASRVRRVLDSFAPLLLEKNRNAVVVLVTGYNDDQRELFLIPEVRPWFHRLFDIVPDLFYWMDMRNGRLLLHALMMHPPVRVAGGTTIRPENMRDFLIWGFSRLNVFCNTHQLDPTPSNQHITACIKEAIG